MVPSVLSYPNAARGALDRARYGPPPLALDRMRDWCYRRLGIWVDCRAGLPCHGMAVALDLPRLRGVVTLRANLPWPRLVLAHEVAHIMTGHQYGLELADDDHYWQRNAAERYANNYAVCLLLDPADILAGAADGLTDEQIGAGQGTPGYAVNRRMELAMLTGECDGLYRTGRPAHGVYLRARGILAPR